MVDILPFLMKESKLYHAVMSGKNVSTKLLRFSNCSSVAPNQYKPQSISIIEKGSKCLVLLLCILVNQLFLVYFLSMRQHIEEINITRNQFDIPELMWWNYREVTSTCHNSLDVHLQFLKVSKFLLQTFDFCSASLCL